MIHKCHMNQLTLLWSQPRKTSTIRTSVLHDIYSWYYAWMVVYRHSWINGNITCAQQITMHIKLWENRNGHDKTQEQKFESHVLERESSN